jgi:hypothetical protein
MHTKSSWAFARGFESSSRTHHATGKWPTPTTTGPPAPTLQILDGPQDHLATRILDNDHLVSFKQVTTVEPLVAPQSLFPSLQIAKWKKKNSIPSLLHSVHVHQNLPSLPQPRKPRSQRFLIHRGRQRLKIEQLEKGASSLLHYPFIWVSSFKMVHITTYCGNIELLEVLEKLIWDSW